MLMLTANNITDEQIRELRTAAHPDDWRTRREADYALYADDWQVRASGRRNCAKILRQQAGCCGAAWCLDETEDTHDPACPVNARGGK